MANSCNLCRQLLALPLYKSARDVSVTSLCELLPIATAVYYCEPCGHLQTPQLQNLETYYADAYKILIESENEDQLYAVIGDRKIFRFDHQADTLLTKLSLPQGAHVLDYGCAKATTLKRVLARRPDIVPYLFDVSDMYLPFWKSFGTATWATHDVPASWQGKFDVVTSFFALEHVAQPIEMLTKIASLLRPDGWFYGIVPNVYANIADLVVVDHVNHFSVASLHGALAQAGFTDIDIDEKTHASALVVNARRGDHSEPFAPNDLDRLSAKVQAMAAYWQSFAARVGAFEKEHAGRPAVIYGSGFYGTFMATCLRCHGDLACFVDRNPYRQGKTLLEKPILDPAKLPDEIDVCYVGLNPAHARVEIQKVSSWQQRSMVYFYP